MALAILLIIVVVFLALIIFVRFFRSMLSALIRFSFLIVVIFLAGAGSAILMNNETIFDRPGWKPRAIRFLTARFGRDQREGSRRRSMRTRQEGRRGQATAKEEEARAKPKKKKEAVALAAPRHARPRRRLRLRKPRRKTSTTS